MSKKHHIVVTDKNGVEDHREEPAARPSEEFRVSEMSSQTKEAFKKVCVAGGATPEEYRHVLESVLTSKVLDEILK